MPGVTGLVLMEAVIERTRRIPGALVDRGSAHHFLLPFRQLCFAARDRRPDTVAIPQRRWTAPSEEIVDKQAKRRIVLLVPSEVHVPMICKVVGRPIAGTVNLDDSRPLIDAPGVHHLDFDLQGSPLP